MITVTFGEDTGFEHKEFETSEALLELKKITDRNIFIDGTLLEDLDTMTEEMLEDASYIMIQNYIIGA